MLDTEIRDYLKKIEADLKRGIATEHTHRSSLEALLESYQPGIKASNDPKHIDCGAPDFIVERRKVPLGYVETKDVGVDLDKIEKTDQMKRYTKALNNLILTDYLEFRWYVNGKERLRVKVAEVGKNNRLIIHDENISQTAKLLQGFFDVEVPMLFTAKDLAQRMAHMAHFMRDLILADLKNEMDEKGALHRQFNAFKEYLLPNLTPAEFADLYAQTMAYGLFAARVAMPDGQLFNRASAYTYLGTNKFLRRLFLDVGEELDGSIIASYLDDLAELLKRANLVTILADFGKRTRTEDPVVHFYETFLAAYDPKLRKSRGVYYTPEPVVRFIVNSVDWILREKFGKPLGLADPEVNILDPAAGTGTFLYFVLRLVHERMRERGQFGQWQDYVHNHLLPRIFGFELLMAPYVMSHLKLGLQLKEELGYAWQKDDQLKVYLTNTLDEGVTKSEMLDGLAHYITDEANAAAVVKKQTPIMVVLGNPPYSYESINNGPWISELVKDYYKIDGIRLNERNLKGLQDDYIKFIRFAEWRINKTSCGILAFITNHNYIDGPTFKGLRKHLNKSFDELYIFDLHGNSKKKEVCPDGSKDENVFDIQQGVAIILGIKNKLENDSPSTKIFHHEIWGRRNEKYVALQSVDISCINWTITEPQEPYWLFKPQNLLNSSEYLKLMNIQDIFPVNSVGIVTSRDELAIHMEKTEAIKTITKFMDLPIEEARQVFNLGQDSRDWKISLAQADLRKSRLNSDNFIRITYRPFDNRFTFFTGHSRGFHSMPRPSVMCQMREENLALITSRINKGEEFAHIFATVFTTEKIILSSKTSNNGYHFPLYLYTNPYETKGTLFDLVETTRKPNLSQAFITSASRALGLVFIEDGQGDLVSTFGPEDVFYYTYAVFHSPTYRSRYAEFLKIDFPRLPLTSNLPLFKTLVRLGKELVDFHLLRTPRVEQFITGYPVAGDHLVEKVQYTSGNVWINPKQYFEGVPEEVWKFKIGGYQVCDKWLKDRKGRKLSGEDINHYQRVVVALKETIRLMAEVDVAIPGWPMD
ncbi:MAG: DNA methyltransferase [Anaerolinea sp.]|nr:DNA methyltransferase [Anaerolinea sp.]